MNIKALIAVASIAALASGIARAESPDRVGQFAAAPMTSQLSRAQVAADMPKYVQNRSQEPNGSRVATQARERAERQAVRAEAIAAARAGKTSHGEVGTL